MQLPLQSSFVTSLGVALILSSLSSACGGSNQPAESAADETAAESRESGAAGGGETEAEGEASEAAASGPVEVPSDCFKKVSGVCVPEPKFVKRLCNGRYPSMALYLFGNSSKWTRAYLTRKTEAWNASGGASAGGYLEFDEEVLLLAERKADTGGMQVSGAGAGYDAIRWDGSCVTLSGEEITQQRPPSAKNVKVEWRFLDDNVQEALRKDEKINKAFLERRSECKGATTGDVSAKCVKADDKLSESIVSFVRGGGSVPVPSKLPD
ncbi:MAG: hypothetical protein M3020_28395 [Myxococcota bacterium]|jgi:hypothetical protein|nr:hypothetical protein [Myxococcota bacterium]